MLYDKNGRAFELGDEVGFGREGSTYHIVGEPFVAKIYHNATPQITRKIESMASILSVLFERKKQLLLKLAWPLPRVGRLPRAAQRPPCFCLPRPLKGNRAIFCRR